MIINTIISRINVYFSVYGVNYDMQLLLFILIIFLKFTLMLLPIGFICFIPPLILLLFEN